MRGIAYIREALEIKLLHVRCVKLTLNMMTFNISVVTTKE